MTFLPIVERELRVAARRPAAFRARLVMAVVTFLIVLFTVVGNTHLAPQHVGKLLLIFLSVIATGWCLLAGVFLTSDCLSVEKREGTLGLLFLTDLKGYDVVLGKLAATSLHAVYGLLAIFPMLSLPILIGGVTGNELVRVMVVLLATLLWSLSLGLCMSSLGRDSRKVMGWTFCLIILLAGMPWFLSLAGILMGMAGVRSGWIEWWGWVLPSSPVSAVVSAFDGVFRLPSGPAHFGWALGVILFVTLVALSIAARVLPRARREEAAPALSRDDTSPRRQGAPRLQTSNPYEWLVSRALRPASWEWALLVLVAAAWLWLYLGSLVSGRGGNEIYFVGCLAVTFVLHLLVKARMAIDASRQISRDVESGALELLLVSPLTREDIIAGQRGGFRKRFRWHLVLLTGMNLILFLSIATGRYGDMSGDVAMPVAFLLGTGVVFVFLDARALAVAGLWMGLKFRKHHRATLSIVARALLPPWAALVLFVFMAVLGGGGDPVGFCLVFFLTGTVTDALVLSIGGQEADRLLNTWAAGGEEPAASSVPESPEASASMAASREDNNTAATGPPPPAA